MRSTVPDPRRLSRDDLKLAALDAFAARLAEAFTERRGYGEAPDGYHRYLHEDISEWVEDALTGLCFETPDEWCEAERADAAERKALA